ncbi:Hypothetical predicted protein [Marmota monax]|uniref:Uncharacterized protein n=1 Tax=Marmota monax TaxID=9995 RepID=A0A5E4A6E1_MARMO|nr:hypothetical protein GHT09_015822 [Marmota monax]VTJ52261.1 Hypothetical predicted protein [Marmota monax]
MLSPALKTRVSWVHPPLQESISKRVKVLQSPTSPTLGTQRLLSWEPDCVSHFPQMQLWGGQKFLEPCLSDFSPHFPKAWPCKKSKQTNKHNRWDLLSCLLCPVLCPGHFLSPQPHF